MTESLLYRPLLVSVLLGAAVCSAWGQGRGAAVHGGDHIAVIVNQELVTAGELEARMARVQAEAGRGARLPPEPELRRQVLDSLIDERVMISTARESGMRIEESEIDRAVQSIAAQHQISPPVLRERLRAEGTDYAPITKTVTSPVAASRTSSAIRSRSRVQSWAGWSTAWLPPGMRPRGPRGSVR